MMKGDDQVTKNKTSATEHDSSIKLDLNTRLTKKVKSSSKKKRKIKILKERLAHARMRPLARLLAARSLSRENARSSRRRFATGKEETDKKLSRHKTYHI